MVSPSKRRAALGLLAMHKPPSKLAFKSRSSIQKKLSFATFQQYDACKGYRYHATAGCIRDIGSAGYEISDREREEIPPPQSDVLNWTVASPPIIFGTVSSSEIQLRLASRGTTSDLAPAGSGGISGLQSFPILGSSEPGPSSSNVVPSSSQVEASFDQMINDMVDEIVTC